MKKQFYPKLFLFALFLSFVLQSYKSTAQSCNPLSLTFNVAESRCAATGSVAIAVAGGSGSYLYKLSGPVITTFTTNDTITGLPAGKYQVIIKDIVTGCQYQNDSVTITGNYLDPSFLMNKTDVTCINGSDGTINVYNEQNGRAPFIFSIVAPSASNIGMQNAAGSFTGLLYGDYTIRLTDSCGGIQTRMMTINNYDWWIDSINVARGCDSGVASIKLRDSKDSTTPSAVFNQFTYAVITQAGDTIWSTNPSFNFLLAKNRTLVLLAKDKCGNSKTINWTDPNIPSVNANVSISNQACSTFTAVVTGITHFTKPLFCLYDSTHTLINCDTVGRYKNLLYGSYCIEITDQCFDTTILRCFTVTQPKPSVAANILVSNTTCTDYTASVTAQTGLTNPVYCLYTKDTAVLIECNTTGVFNNLLYGNNYCIKITNSPACYDTVITRCFTIMQPRPAFTGINITRLCNSINLVAADTANLENAQFCLYDVNGVVIVCNSNGVFTNLPYGTYCIEIKNDPACYDTTMRQCITVVKPLPAVNATVKTSAKNCTTFTAEIQGQQNLNSAQYCLYNSSNVLLHCNTTGKFTNLNYGTYCIRITNNPTCYDTVITRCFTVTQPRVNFTLSADKSCTAYGTTDITVNISSGVAPYTVTILNDAGNVMLTTAVATGTFVAQGLPNLVTAAMYTVIVTDQCGGTDTLLISPVPSLLTKTIAIIRKCPSGINPEGAADFDITATTNMGTLTPRIIKRNSVSYVVNCNYHSGSLYRFNQLPPAQYIIEYATTGCTAKLYDTVSVQRYLYPDLSQSAAYRCDGNNITISVGASVTGGMAPFMYEIFQNVPALPSIVTPAQTSPVFTFSNTVLYSLIRLRAVDVCGNASINDLSIQPLAPVFISPSTPLTCYYDSLRLRVDTIANAVYQWYHKTSPTDSVLVSNTYWHFINAIQPADTGWYVCHVSVNNYCLNRSAYYHLQNMCGVTLPVQLVLKAAGNKLANQLSWLTANETDVNEYIIERSSAANNGFAAIGKKQYAGNGTVNQYIFDDEKPLPGNNYYRLKINTTAGRALYSNTVLVKSRQGDESIMAYPNPVQQLLTVDLGKLHTGNYLVDMFNTAGAKVYSSVINTGFARQLTISRSANITAGVYMVVVTNKATALKQFIKVMYQ